MWREPVWQSSRATTSWKHRARPSSRSSGGAPSTLRAAGCERSSESNHAIQSIHSTKQMPTQCPNRLYSPCASAKIRTQIGVGLASIRAGSEMLHTSNRLVAGLAGFLVTVFTIGVVTFLQCHAGYYLIAPLRPTKGLTWAFRTLVCIDVPWTPEIGKSVADTPAVLS